MDSTAHFKDFDHILAFIQAQSTPDVAGCEFPEDDQAIREKLQDLVMGRLSETEIQELCSTIVQNREALNYLTQLYEKENRSNP